MDYSAYTGCLLGLAVGDAMGYSVDGKTWDEICADYGPNGLLGYDLANGGADVTSYTQLAAYTANGLLLSATRGKGEHLRYITLSLREWARNQNYHRDPEQSHCWVAKPKALRLHLNRDARMLDALRFEVLGTPESPRNRNEGPGVLTPAVAIALFFDPKRMTPDQIGTLAVRTGAQTHGDPEAFLSAAVVAYSIAGIVRQPELALKEHILHAVQVVDHQFRDAFPLPASQLAARLKLALNMAEHSQQPPRHDMEQLQCMTASSCLAGAVYAAVSSADDFDTAMITAVNHSGLSAATGALTGALLGAKLGEQALPDFYLEGLSCADVLRTLAKDLTQGSPTTGLFDDDWDRKYVQGLPL